VSAERVLHEESDTPPLENGDRLTRDEFERRYDAMPHVKKAELIEGVVHMPSPVRHTRHGRPHLLVGNWLGHYWAATPGVDAGDNSTLRLDLENEPQPDVFLMILPEHGGQARIGADDYVEGAPELIVEVAASSASYDLHDKLGAYQRCGVREYVVWRVLDRAVDWFVLREEVYERLAPSEDGVYRGELFPGLWLDVAALVSGDVAAVLRGVQEGLASPEHAEFVQRLQAAASDSSADSDPQAE
jgi:Uma2 family endonuclease